jgi:hypothetical protein
MKLDLNDAEANELRTLLDGAVSDLSPEIADTDNPFYRDELRKRRAILEDVRSRLGT